MPHTLTMLIATHGYWIIAAIVGLESMGLPVPGETTLVTAAVYAGSTRQLSIVLVVMAATVGAIVGDNLGYWVGRRYGLTVLHRYATRLHLTPRRLKLGQFLFRAHAAKVVFFGRFVAVLRTLAGLLAGLNGMPWRQFLLANVAGGVAWAVVFGFTAFWFGERIERVRGPLSLIGTIAAVALVLAGLAAVRHAEERLETLAQTPESQRNRG